MSGNISKRYTEIDGGDEYIQHIWKDTCTYQDWWILILYIIMVLILWMICFVVLKDTDESTAIKTVFIVLAGTETSNLADKMIDLARCDVASKYAIKKRVFYPYRQFLLLKTIFLIIILISLAATTLYYIRE